MLKKILAVILLLLVVFIAYIVQLNILNTNLFFGVKPNLILILVVVVSLWYGIYAGTIFGMINGLFLDLMFSSEVGKYLVIYTLVALIVGFFNQNFRKENKMSLVYVVIYSTAIFEIGSCIFTLIGANVFPNIFTIIKVIFTASLLNIVLAYILYNLFSYIGRNINKLAGVEER